MKEPEWINGLPFYEPSNARSKVMNIGDVIEDMIYLKSKYGISFPDDNAINDACNILARLPRNCDVADWIIANGWSDENPGKSVHK